ncbi:hypothetical protein ACIQCF_07640 [Streptomyces sp. NPDC088353]|uniref:hypothetical protein n=1 Tax=Streptomyces sp. NPDC088353 TaxID=3365855 RepID=UPI0037F44452
MNREELLAQAREHLWAAWTLSSEEIGSQAAETLLGLGMLVPEGGAQELEQLRERASEQALTPEVAVELNDLRTRLAGMANPPREVFLALYDGAEPELFTTVEAARECCDDLTKTDANGRCWDWQVNEYGVHVQFWTHPDDDRPVGDTSGTVTAVVVQGDEPLSELEQLRARVAELEAQREALAERLRAGQEWQRGRTPELVSENFVSQSELRSIFGIPLTAPWDEDPCHPCGCPKRFDRHADGCPTLPAEADGITRRIAPTQALSADEPAAVCRCDEPGADPYSCEADDCSGHFSELDPFGGARPVNEPSAEVSRKCSQCTWRTTVWHVDDGSAEEELHGHVTRAHGPMHTEAGDA